MNSKPESIITKYMDYCLICGKPRSDIHHVCEGTGNRRISDRDNLLMPLCLQHHNQSGMSVHNNKEMKALSHIIGELAWERQELARMLSSHTDMQADDLIDKVKTDFRKHYGKNYC